VKQVKQLEEPSLKCCQLVYDESIHSLGEFLNEIVREASFVISTYFFDPSAASLQMIFTALRLFQLGRGQLFKKAMTSTTKLVPDMVA
jgi:vacuolar protein sorting-associated protein 1